MSGLYPIMLNLVNRLCVVIGGGNVAQRKVTGLLGTGAKVKVVSPELTAELSSLASAGAVEHVAREYIEGDLEGATLAFTATDREDINTLVADEARRRSIWLNAADSETGGDYVVPAVVRRGELVLAVSASGAGPALSARIRRELAERYGPPYERYVQLLRKVRTMIKTNVSDVQERRKLLAIAATEEWLHEWHRMDEALELVPPNVIHRLRERA